jgi:hypothetical protein
MSVYVNTESPRNTQLVCGGNTISYNLITKGLKTLPGQYASDSSLYGLSWPSTGYANKNGILHTTFQNPNRILGMDVAKKWTSNIYSVFFRSSQKSPTIKNLLGAPKYSGTLSFPCTLPNYLKHVQLD